MLIAAVAFLSLYVDMSLAEFVRLAAAACALQFAYSVLTLQLTRRLTRPVDGWIGGDRSDESTVSAWRAAASLPRDLLVRGLFGPPLGPVLWSFFLVWCLYLAWEVDLPVTSALLVYVAAIIVVSYGTALRFFGVERIVRPVLEDIAATVSAAGPAKSRGLSLRARLLAALPAINVITAVVAYGLARGGRADLGELLTVLGVATGVAASVSLLLTVLLSNSITEPIARLCAAVRQVGAGDLTVRLAVVTTDETGELTTAFNEMAEGLEERERIRDAFGTYVDRDVAEHILREGTSLAGEQVEVTMMFIDVRDFTGFAERASAPEVVATINRLFEQAVPIIHAHNGHVDKFVGDGLLAVFGAPTRQADHANQALAAALEIERAVREELAGEIEIGIGLNSGTVVAGNVGGAGRFEFSVIGDAVNIAARVEAATRQTGDTILLADDVKRLLRDPSIELEARPRVSLKGKREAVTLYAPAAAAPRSSSAPGSGVADPA